MSSRIIYKGVKELLKKRVSCQIDYIQAYREKILNLIQLRSDCCCNNNSIYCNCLININIEEDEFDFSGQYFHSGYYNNYYQFTKSGNYVDIDAPGYIDDYVIYAIIQPFDIIGWRMVKITGGLIEEIWNGLSIMQSYHSPEEVPINLWSLQGTEIIGTDVGFTIEINQCQYTDSTSSSSSSSSSSITCIAITNELLIGGEGVTLIRTDDYNGRAAFSLSGNPINILNPIYTDIVMYYSEDVTTWIVAQYIFGSIVISFESSNNPHNPEHVSSWTRSNDAGNPSFEVTFENCDFHEED